MPWASSTTERALRGATAAAYGELKATLALARQHTLTLVTRDAHFTGVPGLVVERWGR